MPRKEKISCSHPAWSVVDSRINKDGNVRRRRECLVCKVRRTSFEIPSERLQILEAESAAFHQIKSLIGQG